MPGKVLRFDVNSEDPTLLGVSSARFSPRGRTGSECTPAIASPARLGFGGVRSTGSPPVGSVWPRVRLLGRMCQLPSATMNAVEVESDVETASERVSAARKPKSKPPKAKPSDRKLASRPTDDDDDDDEPINLGVGKVLSLSAQERPALLLALLMRLISEGSGMVVPLVLAEAYDAVVEGYGQPDEAENTRDIVTRVFIFVISLHVAGNIFGFLAGAATGIAGERVVSRLRRRLYDHLLTQEMGFFDRHKSGDLVSRLGADTLLVQQATTQSLNEVSIGLIKVLSGVILMFIVSWELTFIVFASLLGWLCLVMNPLMRVVQRLTTRYQEALAKAAIASTEVHRPYPPEPRPADDR